MKLLQNYIRPVFFYHLLLFLSFSISLNNLIELQFINLLFYVFCHFIIIYMSLYYFNFILYFVFCAYGIFFDVLLLNDLGPHLLVFIFLLTIVYNSKKYFLNLSAKSIHYLILFLLCLVFLVEMLLAEFILNYSFDFKNFIIIILIGLIIFFPSIFVFSKLDRL